MLTKAAPEKIAVIFNEVFLVRKWRDKTVRLVKINQRGESQRLEIASSDAKTQPAKAT